MSAAGPGESAFRRENVFQDAPCHGLTPPAPGYQPPLGRMDLVITNGDFSTIIADVTLPHPNLTDNDATGAFISKSGEIEENEVCSQD